MALQTRELVLDRAILGKLGEAVLGGILVELAGRLRLGLLETNPLFHAVQLAARVKGVKLLADLRDLLHGVGAPSPSDQHLAIANRALVLFLERVQVALGLLDRLMLRFPLALIYLGIIGVIDSSLQGLPSEVVGALLDCQLGLLLPIVGKLSQIQRMIDKGYLKYDNVEVALDPEYHVAPGHLTPGIPVGQIDASQLNAAQKLLDEYVQKERLAHRKILVVHQFGDKAVNDSVPWMITNKTDVTLSANVDLVIDADKLGDPATKVTEYNEITDNTVYPFIHYRGIKVFPKGANAQSGNYDNPLLTWHQVFGLDPTPAGAQIQHAPDLVIIN